MKVCWWNLHLGEKFCFQIVVKHAWRMISLSIAASSDLLRNVVEVKLNKDFR